MARPLRLELPWGLYHVFNRGNERKDIFRNDEDRNDFLALMLGERERCNWIIHDFALMDNHFHLVIETPEANLSKGMQRLEGTYAQRFNKRHDRCGHLFGGRFKSKLVEKESYLLALSRYVALNPVEAGMVERPEDYRWSSYRAKAGYEEAPAWLEMSGLDQLGPDREAAQAEYRAFVEAKIGVEDTIWDNLVGQVFLGSAAFIERVQELIDQTPRSSEHPRSQRDVGRPSISAVMGAVCEALGLNPEQVRERRGHVARMVFAELGYWEGLRTLREIARELGLRSAGHVSNLIRRCRLLRETDEDLRLLVNECLTLARAHAPPLPPHYLSEQREVPARA
jgi:putative transposase